MASKARIILWGKSLIVAGAAASLRGEPDLQIIWIEGPIGDVEEQLEELGAAGAVIFDVAEAGPGFVMRFLIQHPSLRLVGLDAARNVVTIFSGKRFVELSFGDLAQLVRQIATDLQKGGTPISPIT